MSEPAQTLKLPWVEKYRPHVLADVVGQGDITKRLESYVKTRDLPNLMFSGHAGIGKTSAAVALAREMFGEEYSRNFLELNASDDRGIDVVRSTIKEFARTLAFNADFKIIFLDESDALTADAQQALRRTMEKYSKTCRFILSCVTPETKINTPEETETTIGDFLQEFSEKRTKEILNMDEKGHATKSDLVLCALKQNPKTTGKKVFELTTNTGRIIRLTDDHPIMTSAGWKPAGQIKMDEKIVVLPSLEGTSWPNDPRPLFDVKEFEHYLGKFEEKKGYLPIGKTDRFGGLTTHDKKKIIARAKEHEAAILSKNGITQQESKLLGMINAADPISRLDLQKKMQLSRMRVVQCLQSIEKKGLVLREKKGKMHFFIRTSNPATAIRNYRDIEHAIRREFNIKVSYSEIRKSLSKPIIHQGRVEHTMNELTGRGLLSLQCDSTKTFPLIRILGFIYGDGHIIKNKHRIIFIGNAEALNEVKKDISVLGYSSGPIFSKELRNTLDGRTFDGTTTWFNLDSVPLANLLSFLGAPVGDKIITPYSMPEIVKHGNKLIKREFLRAMFGCEGYGPKIKKMNFEAVSLRMNKSNELRENMLEFFNELKTLLNEFEIESYINIQKLDYTRKDGKIPECYQLILKSNNQNLFRFFSRVGYAFETEKMNKARMAAEYLRAKEYYLTFQKKKSETVLVHLGIGTKSKRQIARENECSVDFVINQSRGKSVHLPRDFPAFDEWKENCQYRGPFVFNHVIQMKEIDATSVMDVMCHNDHNFIGNGIVLHNCNYSSRIIEPIQSRCVVFRFKPLGKKALEDQMQHIAKTEGLTIDAKAIDALEYVAEGDLRKSINVLQACASHDKKITEDIVYSIANRAKPKEVKEMISLAMVGKFMDAREKLDVLMLENGLSGEDVIKQIHKEVLDWDEKEVDSKTKIRLVDRIGEYDFRIVEGANERIQIEALLAQIGLVASEKK